MNAKNRDFIVLRCAVFLLFYLISPSYSNAIYNITLSQTLFQGQTLVSKKEVFELGFFSPNNSGNQYVGIWFKQISPPKIVWVANRESPLEAADSSASLTINRNGNLELLDGKNKSVWSTNISDSSNTSLAILMDNGNFILKDGKSGQNLWESFSHPSDTFLTGTVEIKFGERYVLTSWKSESDPSIGDFIVGLSLKRPPEAIVWNGTIPHWRSGPWDKTKFVGIPDADVSYLNVFDLVEDLDAGKVLFSFNKYYNTTIANLYISPEGVLKIMRYNKDQDWFSSWEAPRTQCDVYGACGSYGVCKASESLMCKCLKGFVPKSFEEWSRGNWTGGCVRNTQLLCEKNTNHSDPEKGKIDVFWKMENMKLPDFYEYVQVPDPESCNSWCLNNCSCQVYTYVNGIGCLVWSKYFIDTQEFSSGGKEFFIRLAPSELARGKDSKKLLISLVVAIPGGVILGVIIFICCKRRANQKGSRMGRNTLKFTRNIDTVETSDTPREAFQGTKHLEPADLPIYDFDTILVATNNFSITNKLGQGGFGTVYKGKLQDDTDIAVKRLSSSSGQGIEEFKNEMILISKLQHRNLVRLLGCCIENEEKLLIYEFMSNKSLDTFLFDPTKKAELFWARRFNIIHGVARGLLYLHRDSALRVIHRDLKVSNILLDEKMNPKISDFGLARIFQGTLDLTNTHRVVGTLGYMSPEYAMGGVFSEKSDVFSFGVLLLEIVSGRKNSSFHYRDENISLIAFAWNLWNEGRALDLMDEALASSNSSVEVTRCIHIALLCVQDHATGRPNMSDVVFMLTNETDRPQPKQPIFTFQSSLNFDFQLQSATSGSTYSVNEATMSIVEAR